MTQVTPPATVSPARLGALAVAFMALFIACSDDNEASPDDPADPDAGIKLDSGFDAGPDAGDDAGDTDGGMEDAGGGGGIDPEEEPFRTLRGNAFLSGSQYDIVFVGDGYTQAELDTAYDAHVAHVAGRMFSRRRNGATEPFFQFRDLFNAHRVHLVSNESGIDEEGVERDTALDGTDNCGSIGGLCFVDLAKTRAAVAAALEGSDIEPDLIVVVLNTAQPLEGVAEDAEGRVAVYGGGPTDDEDVDTSERGLRQIARAMAGLALTTPGSGAYIGSEPDAPNLTLSASGEKWSAWIGFDEENDEQSAVGAYEGGEGFATGVFRPVAESKLTGDYPAPFDPVAREAIILALFETVPLLKFTSDNTSVLEDPAMIFAEPNGREAPRGELVSVEWFVDGQPTGQSDDTFGFDSWAGANGLAIGEHTVEVRATTKLVYRFPDCNRCQFTEIPFVRRNTERLETTITWQVVKTR